jgi:hypothetical protein
MILGSVLALWCAFSIPSAFPENSRPPWRLVAGLMSDEAAGEDVLGQESRIEMPLDYYDRKNSIYDVSDYENRPNAAQRIVFVCRPPRCSSLATLGRSYRIVDESDISFVGDQTQAQKIDIYFLQRLTNPQN